MERKNGFTLVELLVTALILSFILAGLYMTLDIGKTTFIYDRDLLGLQQGSRNAMDRMIREIRESNTTDIESLGDCSDKITFTTPNELDIQYYRDADTLIREYPHDTTAIIAHNITCLSFTSDDKIMTIAINASILTWREGVLTYSLREKVRLRNE